MQRAIQIAATNATTVNAYANAIEAAVTVRGREHLRSHSSWRHGSHSWHRMETTSTDDRTSKPVVKQVVSKVRGDSYRSGKYAGCCDLPAPAWATFVLSHQLGS